MEWLNLFCLKNTPLKHEQFSGPNRFCSHRLQMAQLNRERAPHTHLLHRVFLVPLHPQAHEGTGGAAFE